MMLWRGPSRCPIGGVEGLYSRGFRCLASTYICSILRLIYENETYLRMLLHMKANGVSACLHTLKPVTSHGPFGPSVHNSISKLRSMSFLLSRPPPAPVNLVPLNHTCPVSQGRRRLYLEAVLKPCPGTAWQDDHALTLFPGLVPAACGVLSIFG